MDDVDPAQWGTNRWNNSYPSGGNYWSDYEEKYEGEYGEDPKDGKNGPNQEQQGSDGIWDKPYKWIAGSAGAKDNYPLVGANINLINIYTTKTNGDYERVFKYEDDFKIIAVLRNNGTGIGHIGLGDLNIEIKDLYAGDEITMLSNSEEYDIPAGKSLAINFTWSCSKEDATWVGSGFTFIGKKLEANATFGSQSKSYEFYIDAFGIPEWLRNVRFVESTNLTIPHVDDLKNYHEGFSKRANNLGFNAAMIDLYNKYGYHESHQPSTINYWFPASTSPYTYYSTPRQCLVDLYLNQGYTEEQSKEEARGLIKELVDVMHNHGVKVIGYIDPNGLYSPNSDWWKDGNEYWEEEEDEHGGATVAHHKDTEYGWCRRHDYLINSDTIERLDYVETFLDLAGQQDSDVDKLALEVCPTGNSTEGWAWEDSGFEYSDIEADIDNFYNEHGDYNNLSGEDPSWHYEQVKQMHFLAENYGFDIINVDDTGRGITKPGPAPYYKEDVWAFLLRPGCPTDPETPYKTCDDNRYCQPRREAAVATKDGFALDSYANMLRHMRWQLKPSGEDNEHGSALMSGDYFVPSDVTWDNEEGQKTYWKSITAVEDASVSDQFDVWESEFARWAYTNFNLGYRVLRTDLRRTFTFIHGLRPEFPRHDDRPALQKSLMLATAWANRVHCDLNDERDVKEVFSQSLFSDLNNEDFEDWRDDLNDDVTIIVNYLLMRKKLDEVYPDNVPLPLFKEREAQELLYHQRFVNYYDMKDINQEGEFYYLYGEICNPSGSDYASEPYTVLYSSPCEYGEKGRILHVMNSRVISDAANNEVAADYMFKIKIPEGEDISNIYLVSPDLYNGYIDPDRDGNPTEYEQQNFISNIIDKKGELWSIVLENNHRYLKIKVPHVIAYTIVLIEFNELEEPIEPAEKIARKYMPNIYQLQCDIDDPKNNSLIKVGYHIEEKGEDEAKIEYNLAFKDEDHPLIDDIYDEIRKKTTGRLEDIETFYITVDLKDNTIKEIDFSYRYVYCHMESFIF